MNDFLNAVRFLTILPVPPDPRPQPGSLARAMVYFPLAGLLIAVISYGVFILAGTFLPHSIALLALLISPVVISGGLHMDGLADFCDGFFGGREKSSVLRIMKDSRIGAFGALGLVFAVLSKYELLKVGGSYAPVFFLAMTASRGAQVALSFFLPYAGESEGLGSQTAGKVSRGTLLGASVFMILPALFFLKESFFILLLLAPALFTLGFYFKKRVGGVTGDLLGAASELTEIFVFLVTAAMVNRYDV